MLSNNGQMDISCNVAFSVVHGDTGERETQYIHNRVTKNALMGIIHFIYGDFNVDSSVTHKKVTAYTPKYLALGGIPLSDYPAMSYAPSIGVNVKKLDHEFTGENENRIIISSRQITNPGSADYIVITFRVYVPSEIYQNVVLFEAGLFVDEEGDNCWSKIALTRPIQKRLHDYVDVLWEVKVRSTSAYSVEENYLGKSVITSEDNFVQKITPDTLQSIIYELPIDEDFGGQDMPDGLTPTYSVVVDGITNTEEQIQEYGSNPDTLDTYNLLLDSISDGEVTISEISTSSEDRVKLASNPTITIRCKYEWMPERSEVINVIYKDYQIQCNVVEEEPLL